MAKLTKTKLEWQIVRNRVKKAADRAEQILAVTGLLRQPVDPFAIAASEETITMIGDDFRQRFDGQLEFHRKQSRFLLFYNNKYDRGMTAGSHHPRTRFSVSHELGHFYLDAHHAYLRQGGSAHGSRGEFVNDTGIEREADAFAAGLLLPSTLLRPLVNEDQISLNIVEKLAEQFNTSLVCTALRSVALSDFPNAMVGVRGGRIAWSASSQPMIEAGFYPPSRGATPSRSGREHWAAFESGAQERSKGSAFAREWFRIYDRDELGSVHVTEHYLPVPSMETLVALLTIPEDALATDDDSDDDDEQ